MEGDTNHNATCKLEYREAGGKEWRRGVDMWRVDSTGEIEKIPEGQFIFAGSVFALEPGTKYELRLTLEDADGGGTEKVIAASTRGELSLPKDMRVRYVVHGEGGGAGTKEDPFKGLAEADAAAAPGDAFEFAPGTYEGTWRVTKSGAPGRPIVWRGPRDNSAVIDGMWAERAVSAEGIEHVWFEHLSITKAQNALVAHGSSYVVVRRCRIFDTDCGFVATHSLMKGNVVVDNLFEGRVPWMQDGKHITFRTNLVLDGKKYDISDMHAVMVSGEGTVVAYNRMKDWGDGIHGTGEQPKNADDFYNNEISECADDGIEADSGAQNIRVWENRITNCWQGISTQPVFGGPIYIFRNAIYNINVEPFKLHNSPRGVLLINNTTVKSPASQGGAFVLWTSAPVYHVFARNNLFAGGSGKYAIELSPALNEVDLDYDGYAGAGFAKFATWSRVPYDTLAEFQKATGQEMHCVMLPPEGLFASGLGLPKSPEDMLDFAKNDLRPAEKSGAIDAGIAVPGITDGYKGKAPDLGAYEYGTPLPHYGPRVEE